MLSDAPKKLQVFVSSTFTDLKKERQAAVMAILEANHIPAGMELFAAGDKSQMEVIKHWIDESDVYLLILGKRYGSIDPGTLKSYIELEYDYALLKNKATFACVLDEQLQEGSKSENFIDIEKDTEEKLKKFREKVASSRIIKYWNNEYELKLSIIQALNQFQNQDNLRGWIKSPDADVMNDYLKYRNEFIKPNINSPGKVYVDPHLQFINHANAFEEVSKLIQDYVSREAPDHIDLKFMGVAMRYSIDYIEKNILEIAKENPKVRFLCKCAITNSKHLEKFQLDTSDCDWAEDSRNADEKLTEIVKKYKQICIEEKRDCNFRFEISRFDEIPQRHGILLKLDHEHLFLGVSDWDMACNHPRLTVGSNKYRHHSSERKEGRFWIDIFKHWFMFYQSYQRNIKKT
ncbi:DUF4062 domain-containing protein [Nitrosomonas oligotropha]|uniref:DUF4062 domain-containing protein n=1 Tax=Nitrosomonas oligotropha TaxID=42354 RepID=UPI00136ADB8C|nr:DUF4062 domain-containing protein [Nitrosomonas oligotropha]MXS81524.1 DUF4062 domain-containing protein [Nitrosomonas oligotropha]